MLEDAQAFPGSTTALYGRPKMDSSSGYTSGPERGIRRRKLAGYLKAANELRQSYQQAYGLGVRDGSADEDETSIPGAFPDASVVRSGDEEMLLFPSYARRHQRAKKPSREIPGASDDLRNGQGSGDAQYWKKQWEDYEDQSSIIDVDMRGWVYSPHKGQMTRKNRLLVGIARHLSGVPAPSNSRPSSPQSAHRVRVDARSARHEEDMVEKEAESIKRKGQGEAEIAGRGGYSEVPSRVTDLSSIYSSPDNSRSPSPAPSNNRQGSLSSQVSSTSLRADSRDSGSIRSGQQKRASWNHPADMSPAELSVANTHLLLRLKPFLTTPLVSTPLTIFFYNQDTSRSRTVMTNESGHFQLRAALDFVPTHVRVLASDKLSATEEVRVTEPEGISMISDIDDTIKHSAIGAGAKEIFRNTFIRNLEDLTIEGVKEWYTTMSDMGVKMHYVSNAPWQLYPLLVSFFAGAGLPKGSFHLKQYSGMLQGIFEPVAERKKGTLDKIIADFPERRFILVGDSGEADLELYTDIMLANPGRILGVFIRDVTTTKPQGFFDSAMRSRGSRSPFRGRRNDSGSLSPKIRAKEERPPILPPRNLTRSLSSTTVSRKPSGPTMGNLIDFDEDPPTTTHEPENLETVKEASPTSIKTLPPSRPTKPLSLRSLTHGAPSSSPPPSTSISRKAAPPLPPKPRQYTSSTETPNLPSEPSPLSQIQTSSPPGSRATSQERQSYRAAVRNKLASAYATLPSWSSATVPTLANPTPPTSDPADPKKPTTHRPPPPVPPRRNISSYPAAAANYASNRLSGGWSGYSTSSANPNGSPNDSTSPEDSANGNPNYDPLLGLSKKEEMWLRRWQRAKEIFEEKGVVLRSWRVGEDVALECVGIVEGALGQGGGKERGRGRE